MSVTSQPLRQQTLPCSVLYSWVCCLILARIKLGVKGDQQCLHASFHRDMVLPFKITATSPLFLKEMNATNVVFLTLH